MKRVIQTSKAPAAIGTYSQAIQAGNTIYLSGQIPLDPVTQELVSDNMKDQIERIFEIIKEVAISAGGSLDSIVRICVYLTDLGNFPAVNEAMAMYFNEPYPARTTIGISALPKGSLVEVDAIMVVN